MKAADQILFQKYLREKLDAGELAAFERRLSGEEAFSKDFELYKEMEGFVGEKVEKGAALEVLREVGMEERGGDGAGEKVQGVRGEVDGSVVGRAGSRRWFWVVLGMGLLGVAFLFMNKKSKDARHQELLAQYEYPPNRGTRSMDGGSTKLDSAIHYFDLRRMDESEELFLEILKVESGHQDANRYMGHISFLRGRLKESSKHFDKVSSLNAFDKKVVKLFGQ